MKKVLIANRGEIACRIIRTCKALGYSTVAIYSEADESALHVQMADEAYLIGPPPVNQSYLNSDMIIEKAILSGANLIHPGYGLLSENALFAQKVEAAGLLWVGPSSATMELMADKGKARSVAIEAGVPVLPGSLPIDPNDTSLLLNSATHIGLPLLVKATGGGGGIGMQVAESLEDLPKIAKSVSSLAARTFGNNEIFLERYIANARHIEVQVFGLGNGSVFHLLHRECSVQRRFQKIIEEAPAPNLPEDTERMMVQAACELAKSQHYTGAGTVEFILDRNTNEFFFLEMNTRIQVEHPVTEMISNQDIVALQLSLAEEQDLDDLVDHDFDYKGHSLECRLYAEKPERRFLPSPGPLTKFRFPAQTQNIRIDTGFKEGDVITPFYDPMIAKLIVADANRDNAIKLMRTALDQVEVEGISTNLQFLIQILDNRNFLNGNINTTFIDDHIEKLITSQT
ncbi:carbamoyl phosphate synthase [Rhodospirillaceae bacterium]|nr:carbamoyl phosphate synthase [Rhodospirillaceae bacterium]